MYSTRVHSVARFSDFCKIMYQHIMGDAGGGGVAGATGAAAQSFTESQLQGTNICQIRTATRYKQLQLSKISAVSA